MHPRVRTEFERICSERKITGSVLEVGAQPDDETLLCMKSLEGASEKVGLNLADPTSYRDFKIHKGNANSMSLFEDERFDVVICNAVIEHDKYFWKTIEEIKRVTKRGGLIVIGAPGYTYFRAEGVKRILGKTPLIRNLKSNQYLNMFFTATITFQIHDEPGDFYRFSPEAFRDVLFEDMDDVEISAIMLPPRMIGAGRKRAPRIDALH